MMQQTSDAAMNRQQETGPVGERTSGRLVQTAEDARRASAALEDGWKKPKPLGERGKPTPEQREAKRKKRLAPKRARRANRSP